MLFLVILTAIGIQVLMKKMSVDASPELDKETGAEIMSRSILSSVGYSRLYGGTSHILSRHLLSCCMAWFAVVIVSLYCSNLVNFFYTAASLERINLPPPSSVRIHPAFKDIISPETFGIYTDRINGKLYAANMVPNGVYYENMTPVVSRVVGDQLRNSTTKLRPVGGYYTIYETIFTKSLQIILGEKVLGNIMADVYRELDIYQFNKTKYLDFQDNIHETVIEVDIQQVWGAFAIILVGYVTSILFRIFFTEKTGLTKISLFKHPKRENGSMVSRRESITPSTTTSPENTVPEIPKSEITEDVMIEIELNERHDSITIEVV
jgi:hypothetical protein